jgi:hypothetical protein
VRFVVRYHAGPYSGDRIVFADDEEQAIAIARSLVRKAMTLPMYSDSYRVTECEAEEEDEA